jgi:cell division protein FtsB
MAFFFRKPQDPLEAQMRELEARQRALERELEQLQSEISLASPKPPPQPIEVLPPQPSETPVLPRRHQRSHGQLSVERRRIRRRVMIILGAVFVLALIIYRATAG